MIEQARGPVGTPLDALIDHAFDEPRDLVVSLEGEGAAAYEEFRLAAKALAEHNGAGPAIMERYRAALTRLSAEAAK